MDQEVAKTLGELELKLQQLEHELTSIGPSDTQSGRPQAPDHPAFDRQEPDPAAPTLDPPGRAPNTGPGPAASPTQPPGRLVDEAMESSQAAEALAQGERFAGPPVFGGEELPAQPAPTGQDWKVDVRETAYGEIPSEDPPSSFGSPSFGSPSFGSVADRPPPIPPPSPTPQPPPTTPPGPPAPEHPPAPTPQPGPQPIDRAELLRFKQRLEQTMVELSEELGRLLLPKSPT